jgi:hypothetical protein
MKRVGAALCEIFGGRVWGRPRCPGGRRRRCSGTPTEGERDGKPQREADLRARGDFWGTTKSKGLIAKHAIGSIPIAFRGRALMVGEERIWLHPFTEGDAEEIASLWAG